MIFFLISIRYGNTSTSILVKRGKSWRFSRLCTFLIRKYRLLNDWELFSEKFLNVESIFLTTYTKRSAKSIIYLLKNIFLSFLIRWVICIFNFLLLHFSQIQFFLLSINLYPNWIGWSHFCLKKSALPNS